jgi:hypothetical protein
MAHEAMPSDLRTFYPIRSHLLKGPSTHVSSHQYMGL